MSATVARTPPALLPAPQDHRQPHPDEDDPDVLDAVEREQALEVVLLERVEHTEHGRGRAHDEHRPSPGGRERPGDRGEKVEGEAQHPVDRDLEHDARHQRRDVARGRGVRAREPDVERDHAGLGGEARERQEEQRRSRRAVEVTRRRAKGREVERPGPLGQGKECDEEQGRPSVGHHHVEEPRSRVLAIPVVGDDEDVAGERHAFPAEEEGQRVAGAAEERHAAQEHVQREHLRRLPRRSRVGRVRPEVGRTVDGRRDGHEGDDEQEVGREPVDREREPGEREEGRERLGQRAARVAEENAERNAEACHGPRQRGQVTHAERESARPPRQQGRQRPCPVARSHQTQARVDVHVAPSFVVARPPNGPPSPRRPDIEQSRRDRAPITHPAAERKPATVLPLSGQTTPVIRRQQVAPRPAVAFPRPRAGPAAAAARPAP